jgi:dihydroorotate dehydrogenase
LNKLETTISGKRLEPFYGNAAADYTRVICGGNEIEDSKLFTRLHKQGLLGFQTTKTLTYEPRKGNDEPRFVFTGWRQGLQSMGLPNVGIREYPFSCDMPTIVSYTAKSLKEAEWMTRYLDEKAEEEPNIFALEYNTACPNVSGCPSCYKDDSIEHLKTIRGNTRLPVLAKIGYFPEEDSLISFGRKIEDIGINGVTAINSPPGMRIENGRTMTAKKHAGVFGKCLKPLGIRTINILHEKTNLSDLIGLGGIYDFSDAAEYFQAGANAVEICSVLTDLVANPAYSDVGYNGGDIDDLYWAPLLERFKKNAQRFMERKGIESISEIVGKLE